MESEPQKEYSHRFETIPSVHHIIINKAGYPVALEEPNTETRENDRFSCTVPDRPVLSFPLLWKRSRYL